MKAHMPLKKFHHQHIPSECSKPWTMKHDSKFERSPKKWLRFY